MLTIITYLVIFSYKCLGIGKKESTIITDFTYSPPPTTHFESQPQPVYQSHANFESQPAIQTSYHDVGPSYTTQSYRYQPHHQQQQLSVGSPFGISQIISTGVSCSLRSSYVSCFYSTSQI